MLQDWGKMTCWERREAGRGGGSLQAAVQHLNFPPLDSFPPPPPPNIASTLWEQGQSGKWQARGGGEEGLMPPPPLCIIQQWVEQWWDSQLLRTGFLPRSLNPWWWGLGGMAEAKMLPSSLFPASLLSDQVPNGAFGTWSKRSGERVLRLVSGLLFPCSSLGCRLKAQC